MKNLYRFQDGKKYMYESGQWLKDRYGRFLGPLYQPDV